MAQTAKNVTVDYKVESAFNTAPTTADAERLRFVASPGLNMTRALIESEEVRPDQLRTMGRLGSISVPGTYNSELSVGSFDTLIESLMRSTWVAAVTITEADMTSVTVANNNQIVAAAGSWLTEGVRVGDVIRPTEFADAANNDLNLVVTGVTADTITVAGSPLTDNASPDSDFTVTILKKLVNGTTPTRRSFYWDEYNVDLDLSVLFGGVRTIRAQFTGQPDGTAQVSFGLLGASASPQATGDSPFYATPTEYATIPLVWTDAQILKDGTAITTLTGFDFTLDIPASTLPVIGSNTTPDVFDEDMGLEGSLSGMLADLSNLTAFTDETEFEFSVLLEEPSGTPKGCMSFFIPRIKVSSHQLPLGGPGARIEQMSFMSGYKAAATGYDAGLITICSSAA